MRYIYCFLSLIICFFITSTINAAELNKVAAVVNGQVITMYDLQKMSIPDLARARINPDNPAHAKQVNQIFHRNLDIMIMDILIAQEAKRLNVVVSKQDIDDELTRIMKSRNITKEQFEAQLAIQKTTVKEVRDSIRKGILRQKIMGRSVSSRVVVTPEEIKQYYESHKNEIFDRKGLHMGLIVYHPNANAQTISKQIKSGEITFAEACRKYSIAPNKDKGGDMGPVEWSQLNPEWENRLSKMKPGDITEIFEVQGRKAQVYLFRPGVTKEETLTLEQATPQIDAILRQPKTMARFEEYTKQLKEKAVIDIRLK